MHYEDFKYLPKRTASDKDLRDKTFNIAKNSKYGGYERGLASIADQFFDKKWFGNRVNDEIKQNEQLAEVWQTPITNEI